MAKSATSSVKTSGVLVTITPRSRVAGKSMPSYPTPKTETISTAGRRANSSRVKRPSPLETTPRTLAAIELNAAGSDSCSRSWKTNASRRRSVRKSEMRDGEQHRFRFGHSQLQEWSAVFVSASPKIFPGFTRPANRLSASLISVSARQSYLRLPVPPPCRLRSRQEAAYRRA
jgi:hypothetical protein